MTPAPDERNVWGEGETLVIVADEAIAERVLVEQEFERTRVIARTWPGLPSHVDRAALEGAAMEGLAKAARSWDPATGAFQSWANTKVRFAIMDALRASDHLPRSVRREVGHSPEAQDARELGVVVDVRPPISLSTTVGNDANRDAAREGQTELSTLLEDPAGEEGYARVADRHAILDLLRGLTDREIAAVLLRYFGGYSGREIADLFRVTESRVGQIHHRAFSKAESANTPSPKEEENMEVHPTETLSAREQEIILRVAGGLTNDEIATELFISRETVKSHMKNIIAKLEANSRTHAVARGFQLGILSA